MAPGSAPSEASGSGAPLDGAPGWTPLEIVGERLKQRNITVPTTFYLDTPGKTMNSRNAEPRFQNTVRVLRLLTADRPGDPPVRTSHDRVGLFKFLNEGLSNQPFYLRPDRVNAAWHASMEPEPQTQPAARGGNASGAGPGLNEGPGPVSR
jgi:hypothetical protein